MNNNLLLLRNLLFVVKLGKSISDSLWENKKKVIFSYDLGYSCYFGQLENIQWVIMVEYEEKRLGYLVLSLLINESSELMNLNTNTIKNEISHSDRNSQ